MEKYTKFLVFISVLAIAYDSKAQVNMQDLLALVELYKSTDGTNWDTKWDLLQPVNTWYGVTVNGGRVTELSLPDNQLSGSIPGELGNLTNLTSLNLSRNQLNGSIPVELGKLTKLTLLNLESNQLNGNIPVELGNLTDLTHLYLFFNQLSGNIPVELGNLTDLTHLYLFFNQLSGNIPVELGNLTDLTELELYNNQLSGNIPVELGNLTDLTKLHLNNNQLSGSIPVELEKLTNLGLLSLNDNQLSGSIPVEFGKLTKLRQLWLQNNELSGSIPVELGNLTDLGWLDLSNNELSGSIPVEFENLTILIRLNLSNNELSGNIPIELGNLTILTELYLNNNQFNELPDLSSLTSLSIFRVQNNHLDFGDILPNIGLSGYIYSPQKPIREGVHYNSSIGEELILSVQVDGTNNVYQWFRDNTALSSANDDTLKLLSIQTTDHGLYHCQVTNPDASNLTLRSIPDTVIVNEVTRLDSLALVTLYDRTDGANWKTTWDLSQPINTWYGVTVSIGRVARLDLSSNQLSGSIPGELGNLTNLTELYLNNNQFDELSDLSSLISLSIFQVQNNHLDFDDILPNTGVLTDYSPQASIREGIRYDKFIGEELILSVQVEGKNNVYQWFKNNTALSSANDDTLKLSNIQTANYGLYHCRVTNPGVSRLTLRSIPDTVLNASTQLDSLVLVTLYSRTDGANWKTKWDLAQPMNTWYGVTVTSGRVARLDLSDNQLDGNIPVELGDLTNLTRLSLDSNQLNGNIPVELEKLINLTELNLSINQLDGNIPVELGDLINLTRLILGENELNGNIPVELEKLINLTELWLYNNELSGSIPVELGNLSSLTRLSLHGNELSGSIPVELGNLTRLEGLSLHGNELSGSIPVELGNLTRLEGLYLSDNQLNGSISIELGNLTNLTELWLHDNQLSGSIPGELGKLTKLTRLDLGSNQLSGSIPGELEKLTKLTRLSLHGNQLNGSIPAEFGKLINLTRLSLHGNQLNGSIPAEFGKLTRLEGLYLDDNELSGSIPTEFGKLTNLIQLNLSGNQLNGSITREFEKLTKLTNLSLSDNRFDELSDLSSLTSLLEFQVENNRLDFGDILPNIGVLTHYSPQAPIRDGVRYNTSIGDKLTLSVQVDGINNVYQWFRNNIALSNAIDDTLKLTNIQTTDHGLYYCEVTNPDAPALTLQSIPDTVVQRVNSTPTDIALSSSAIEENKAIGTMIGILSTIDPNANDSHIYDLSGTDANNFQITKDTLKSAEVFDYEIKSNYTITIETIDAGGLTFQKDFTISVSDANDAPTDIILSSNRIEENEPIGTMIGILSTTDPDASDDHTYSLSGTDANSFQIIEDTLKSAAVFDYETKNSYTITIQTEDVGGLTFQKDFTISIDEFTALDELDISNEVTIYPNPSKKNIVIEINNHLTDKGFIKIYSLNGKNERSFPFEKNSVKQIFIFTIADLPSGIYILHGELGDYHFTERIFKK